MLLTSYAILFFVVIAHYCVCEKINVHGNNFVEPDERTYLLHIFYYLPIKMYIEQ